MIDAVDLFAGPGGWDIAATTLGLTTVGLEHDRDACQTRAGAGHLTIRTDVTTYPAEVFHGVRGLIASPPCTAWSQAGDQGATVDITRILAAAHTARHGWDDQLRDGPWTDPTGPLVLEVLRWTAAMGPQWVACEQVPPALPAWHAIAGTLRAWGYRTATFVLSAEEYGVPQTRRRAFLVAHTDRQPHAPPPTHQGYEPGRPAREVDTLFGRLEPWVSMAEALGWCEVNTGRDWKPGGSRDDAQTIPGDQPAPTYSAKAAGQWHVARPTQRNTTPRPVDRPAPTIAFGNDPDGWHFTRPATTIAGDPRVWPPGHKINADDEHRLGPDEAAERYGDRAGTDAVKVTTRDALTLQGFPPDYPIAGTKTSAHRQIGNAIPPPLARHVLASVIGAPV